MSENFVMNDFLSKENTINIFKSMTISNNLSNLNKQQKDTLINQIITVMKRIFKTLELQKINKNNLSIVKKQYNEIVIKQTSELYKESNTQTQISNDRQNNRTFNSIKKPVPIPGADRPNSFKSSAGQTVGNAPPSMSADFMKKATEDINTRLSEIENSRRATQERPKPTELPDFLKPQKVGKATDMSMQSSNLPDSKPLLGFNDILDSNFSSSVPPSDKTKYSEQLSTMDRLKQLEADRNMTPNAPVQNTRSEYNNINTMFNNDNNNASHINMFSSDKTNIPSQIQQQQMPPQQQMQYQQMPQQMPHQQIPHQQMPQQMQSQQMQYQQMPQQQMPQQMQYQQMPPQMPQQMQNQPQSQYQELINKMNEMQQTIIILKQENDLLMREKTNHTMNQKKTFTEQLQLEISKKESRYNYQFNTINNITNIKLVNYDLPPALYNILEDINIIYKLLNDNIEKQIIIPKGNYSITNLLIKLNENNDLLFSVNIEEKIVIKSKDNSILFKLINNNFANKLGFNYNDNDNYILILIADRIYDIRHINKLYLYIRNIYQDKPVGILNFNGSSIINLGFNDISLNNLCLEFYTEDNQLYNFNNMNYSLSFIIETQN
jgi:hypothetical protein